jgi:hypothetical protein
MNNPFIYNIPFCKLIGIRLTKWSFLAFISIPEKCIIENIGHFDQPISTNKYSWFNMNFGCKIFPSR